MDNMIISQPSSSSFLASSSTDTSTQLHDVFLSFHGEDTRYTFIGYLYEALTGSGLETYRDDEDPKRGHFIRPELLEAIESSASAVVVISSNYADSKWCLDELAHIVKCKKKRRLLVYPVFYHVDPSNVRHLRCSFKRSFDEHEGDSGIAKERLEAWRSAFEIVGGISGWHVTKERYEHKFISNIVEKINLELHHKLARNVVEELVPIESRVHRVYEMLCLESNDVRVVGIYGMSGIGKTFLAYYIFNEIRNRFECCCFIHNIKNVSKETDDFRQLQQQILDELLRNNNIRVANFMDGVGHLQKRLRGRKCLLVLDDVYKKNQLDNLVKLSWFGPRSRIIITTTNEDVLKAIGVKDDQKYKCELLGYNDARRLFCKKAFGEEHPKQGFEELTDDILRLAEGLPLALAVFGSALSGEEDELCWRNTVQRLQQYPDEDVTGRLEVGYFRLDRNEREIFIYLACFFRLGNDCSYICNMLKDIVVNPTLGIHVLQKRSLVNVPSSYVSVHDQLVRMCWEILYKEFPNKPGKRMALKSHQDIANIMASGKGSNAIRIINDEFCYKETENFHGHRKAFSKMTRLTILRIRGGIFPEGIEYLSNELRHLEWNGYPLKSFPSTFEPRHLIILLMENSKLEQLWENVIDMPNLEVINLSGSEKLTKIPDLSLIPKLKNLKLDKCTSLVEVHQSVFVHNSLEVVRLCGCKRLESLGSKSIDMEAFVHLDLSDCSNLQVIPEFGERTRNLGYLCLSGTSIKKLPSSIWQLEKLQSLRVIKCRYLSTDTSHFMNSQQAIPLGFDLNYCNFSGNEFVTLGPYIGGICASASSCVLDYCKNLQTLPKLRRSTRVKEYELQVDFHYFASTEELDITDPRYWCPIYGEDSSSHYKFISCLNCPRLFENESNGDASVAILKKYMQVGSALKDIPQASFEIFATGSEISPWFDHRGVGNSVHIESQSGNWYDDTWIGISLCGVLHVESKQRERSFPHITFKAYIHVDGKVIMIPIPTWRGHLEPGIQIVRYVSVSNYLRQAADWSRVDNLRISFDLEGNDTFWSMKCCAARMMYKTDLEEIVKSSVQNVTKKRTSGMWRFYKVASQNVL